jgi:hypothetical protein
MAMENVAQGHIAGDEEEVTAVMNWQSGDSNNNVSGNNGSYESTEDELGYLLLLRGQNFQRNETQIIFLRKRYGSDVVHSQS